MVVILLNMAAPVVADQQTGMRRQMGLFTGTAMMQQRKFVWIGLYKYGGTVDQPGIILSLLSTDQQVALLEVSCLIGEYRSCA